MNDEQAQELIEGWLRYLRGQGGPPDLGHLGPEERAEACQLFEVLDAITDMGDDLYAPEDDLVLVGPGPGTGNADAPRGPWPGAVDPPLGPPAAHRRDEAGAAPRRKARVRRLAAARARRLAARSLGAVAAAVFVLAASLVLFSDQAVKAGPLTDDCKTSFGAGAGAERVVVTAVWGEEERDRFKEVLEVFARQTGIGVDFAYADPRQADREIGDTLESLIEQGCAPDVALLPQPGLLRTLAEQEHLEPIDGVAGDVVERNYSPAWQELGEVGGRSYGVWFKAANKSIIWYDGTAFERAGITEAPKDWEALKEVAHRLSEAGITPFSIAGADEDAWALTDWFENVYLRTAGREQYEKLAGGAPWTDPSVRHALERLAEIFSQSHWIAGGTSGALETSYKKSIANVFADEDPSAAAMVFEGDFVANLVPDGADARFFAFPSIGSPEPTVVGTGSASDPVDAAGGDVAVLMTRDDQGKELLRFLATPEAAEPWVRQGGFTSPNRNVPPEVYPDPETTGRVARQLAQAPSLTFDLSDRLDPEFGSTPGQGMGAILRDFLADPTDVDGTARRLEESFRATD